MNYKNCVPALVLDAVAMASAPVSSGEIAYVIGKGQAHVRNVLPDLVKEGKLKREGKRKRYVYSLPVAGAIPAESEMQIASVGNDPETRAAIMRADARQEAIEAKFAALREESVSPVRSEDDGMTEPSGW